ncbi:CoxG protein [mine drainage metagenome]|uniref:CoxG protein n=1 Tax=mine drainage metagenome TaxID=410659 RepID=T0ZBU8_9ZZZZ
MWGTDEIDATIRAGIAFIKGKFKTKIVISEASSEELVNIIGSGTGSNSSLSFNVGIKFDQSGTGCKIAYDTEVNVAGNAATMGQRVIEKAARDYVEKIISNFKKSFR